jgi:hypothetical protein
MYRRRQGCDQDAVLAPSRERSEVKTPRAATYLRLWHIAVADLLPEITPETRTRDELETSAAFMLGLAVLLSATQPA